MQPSSRTLRPLNFHFASVVLVSLSCLLINSQAQTKYSQVLIKDTVSAGHKTELIDKLRTISGFSKMTFAENGSLKLNGLVVNGSEHARELLECAITGPAIIVLEDASGRADVAFCRVVPARVKGTNRQLLPAYVVLVDFNDFRQLTGDAEALAAFDVGWGVLHELDHIVSDSEDARNPGEIGKCEDHINAMRSEIGLPSRSEYFFTPVSSRSDANFAIRYVRLPFESRAAGFHETKRYWLVWDAITVGGLNIDTQRALVR
ncbi:MAG TPA: hypothetical protein VFD63_19615 [Pyrinomonadaceae bacterium]|nr:hypothetical protein [Pyrinomonadaceae bacterium]